MTEVFTTRHHASPMTVSHRLQNSTSSSNHHKSHHFSNASTLSKGYRSSSSTQHTTASTLWSPSSASNASTARFDNAANGQVTAANNVINRVADKGSSMFQLAATLKHRLRAVPDMEFWLEKAEEDIYQANGREAVDPIAILWQTFRYGIPMLELYNLLQQRQELKVEETKVGFNEDKQAKAALFKFVHACVSTLRFPGDEVPTTSQIRGDDTTYFIKFARVVSKIVDDLEEKGYIQPYDDEDLPTGGSTGHKSHRQHVVHELVTTERTYVQHLDVLNEFKRFLEMRQTIPGDALHAIFFNLGTLFDQQQRFLARVEQMNARPEEEQDWGVLFTKFGDPCIELYKKYIANQTNAAKTAERLFPKLQQAGGTSNSQDLVESVTHFTAFLLKPFQRLSKYPLLLKELIKTGEFDEERTLSLEEGAQTIREILNGVNADVKAAERDEAFSELKSRIDDWKDHKESEFGLLCLWDSFTVIKDKSNNEREYKCYLFEKILICVKESTGKKQKLLAGGKPPSTSSLRPKGQPPLILKGRIYLCNVTEIISQGNLDTGSFILRVDWETDDGAQNLQIKMPNDATMKEWDVAINHNRAFARAEKEQKERQKAYEEDRYRRQNEAARQRARSSTDEFQYMQDAAGQGHLQNPYKNGYDGEAYGSMESLNGIISQQASNGSLRSRSAAGEGAYLEQQTGSSGARRYPAGYNGAPLTLRTQQLQGTAGSPMEQGGHLYFSPMGESPISSRTSSSSGVMSFSRNQASQNQWTGEDHHRYTAPAPSSRQPHNSMQEQRTARGPGQAMPMHPASLASNRMRSASSPDVQSQHAKSRQATANAPPVPTVPAHLVGQQPQVNRSQNTTPVYQSAVPSRYPTQSPGPKSRQGSQAGQHQPSRMHDSYASSTTDPRSSQQTQSSFTMTSPPLSAATSGPNPISFRVKVLVPSEGTTFALIVPSIIPFEAMRDRIDAKLSRMTNLTFQSGNLRLQFEDEDSEMITMQNDDDVQTVFDQWRDTHVRDSAVSGQLGEIVLYCNR